MNSKIFSLVSTVVVGILLLIGAILSWKAMNVEPTMDPVTKQFVGDFSAVDSSVNYTMFLLYASVILVGVFTVWGIAINPRKFIPSAIGLGVLLVIFLICYGMASADATGKLAELPGATEFWLKWSDVGVLLTYALFGLAVLLLIVQALRGVFTYFSK